MSSHLYKRNILKNDLKELIQDYIKDHDVDKESIILASFGILEMEHNLFYKQLYVELKHIEDCLCEINKSYLKQTEAKEKFYIPYFRAKQTLENLQKELTIKED